MKTPQQISKETIEKLKEFEKTNEVMQKIDGIINRLANRPVDSWQIGELIETIGALSVLKVNLGYYVSKAMLEYNSAYAYRKFREADAYFALKDELKTVSDTDRQARIETTEDSELQVAKNYQADRLKAYYESIGSLITTIQIILKHKNQERIEANNHQG